MNRSIFLTQEERRISLTHMKSYSKYNILLHRLRSPIKIVLKFILHSFKILQYPKKYNKINQLSTCPNFLLLLI